MCDLDFANFYIFEPYLSTCWAKPFPIFTLVSLGNGHSLDVIKSLAICTTAIREYVMFSELLQKLVFGHNFSTKAHRVMILVSMTMAFGVKESDGDIHFFLYLTMLNLSSLISMKLVNILLTNSWNVL